MESATRIQISDEAVCASVRAKALTKSKNPSVLLPPVGE